MLKDITIGQYYPGKSILHRLDPRMKMIMTFVFIVALFAASNKIGLAVGAFIVIIAYACAKIPLKFLMKSLKPIIPLVLITSVLNLFFLTEGNALFRFWIITVTTEGISFAVVMSVRIICLIAGTSLLTYTTTPIALTDAIEQLLAPLKKIKLPVHELAMMMTIAMRFIPTLIDETDKIMNAQKARGADLETGGPVKRVKALVPILIPLFVSAFRRADELAIAMECRCYQGGEGRTRMNHLKMKLIDLWAGLFILACLAGVVCINIFL
ncbi:MAG: energy-coupling factor transporter transmembrane protein EcfT [Oscillospiraceae bacterium]|jgi:energy-coupling factor transport system permease protein|nr:energy-coupling factor transporter transmembrane protein EcfT [Oscillospiraceae bacterium]